MLGNEDFNRRVRFTALITVALSAALVFGIVVLAGGDWFPGAIIVVAALIGLARQIPVIWGLCSEGPAFSPPAGEQTTPQPSITRHRPAVRADDRSHTPPHGDALRARTRR